MKKNILKSIAIVLFCFQISISIAQPTIEWQKCYGGGFEELATSIQQTNDGGFIVAGFAYSNDGDVTGNHNPGTADVWLVKIDVSGVIQWEKCFGGSSNDYVSSIQQTYDGGYILAGSTFSNDGDVSGNHNTTGPYSDCWIVKINSAGNILWQKCLGGSKTEGFSSIQQTSDGGYIVAGSTKSNDGDVSGNHDISGNYNDYWIVKLDSAGIIQSQKCFGGSKEDAAGSIQQTNDKGYIVAGFSASIDGDVAGNIGDYDYWIVKLDSLLNIQWRKNLGGTSTDKASIAKQTSDGGYIITGWTESNDGDVLGNNGYIDCWVVKLDINGNLQWQKCLGGSSIEDGFSIQQTTDKGYIIAARTSSSDGMVTGYHAMEDYWVVKLDSNGYFKWQKCLGGTNGELPYSIQQTNDGGYIVAGYTSSFDGDITGNHGIQDFWIVKLNSETVAINETNAGKNPYLFPNPTIDKIQINYCPISSIQILNLQGQIIKRINTSENQTTIDISDFARGMYFIKVTTEKEIITKKFIKE